MVDDCGKCVAVVSSKLLQVLLNLCLRVKAHFGSEKHFCVNLTNA